MAFSTYDNDPSMFSSLRLLILLYAYCTTQLLRIFEASN